MALVENNVVKMEWDKAGWLQKKSGTFCFASKEYDSTTKGKVTVFFRSNMAFIWASNAHSDDEDLWNAEELKGMIKSEGMDGAFPNMYDEYVPVIEGGETECDNAVLEEYGIVAYADDIKKRLNDIAPYSEEKDMF